MKKCNNCNFIYVKKEKINGELMLRKQCFSCGKSDGKSYKFSDVGGLEEVMILPFFDTELEETFYNNQMEARRKEYANKREELLVEYSEYLKSDKWKEKRKRVLKRDNYICKACERNKATQVHHISYQFIYDEPLFDLVSVCIPCHNKIERLKLKNKGI